MKNIKLNVLADKEMGEIRGGDACPCGCAYANQGGSSSVSNCAANARAGYTHTAYNGGVKEWGYVREDGSVYVFWHGVTV